jgi:hypothetical protein
VQDAARILAATPERLKPLGDTADRLYSRWIRPLAG